MSLPAESIESPAPRVRIERADCLEFLRSLPEGSVDVLATDPAYSGMNNRLKLGRGRIVGRYDAKGTAEGRWFREFEDSEENYDAFLSECRRVLSPDTGHLYVMFDSYSLLTLGPLVRRHFDVKNLIAWDKVNLGMGHYFRRQHEMVLFATNGNTRKPRNRSFPDVWRFKRIRRAAYPTQKPVELFQAMVHASGEPGYTVCDPFVGAGSCAVAAVRASCDFVGCDVAEAAVELSRHRVARVLATGCDPLQPDSAAVPGERIFWEVEPERGT